MAKLVRRLHEGGAIVVAFDIIFAEPERLSPKRALATWPDTPEIKALREQAAKLPDNDEQLAKAMRLGKTVTAFALTNAKTKKFAIRQDGLRLRRLQPAAIHLRVRGGNFRRSPC